MTDPQVAAPACEHHYETRILGGHPITVPACVFCRKPDWADLHEQAVELYRWGWQEGRDGKAARETLSAYDKPRQAATEATEPATTTDPSWSARCRPPGCGAQPGEPCRRHDGSAASVSHGERWREYDRQQKARTQKRPEPATITDPEWLRQQYAAAVQPLLMDNLPKPIAAARALEIADTVLNVRDRHLAQLRQRLQLADVQPELDRLREQIKEAEAQCREWEDTAYRHAKHWRDEQEASHRLLTQRQDLAAERYVWQERGDQMAATLRQALDAFEAYWVRASYCGPGETAVQPEHFRAWRAVLDGKEQP